MKCCRYFTPRILNLGAVTGLLREDRRKGKEDKASNPFLCKLGCQQSGSSITVKRDGESTDVLSKSFFYLPFTVCKFKNVIMMYPLYISIKIEYYIKDGNEQKLLIKILFFYALSFTLPTAKLRAVNIR